MDVDHFLPSGSASLARLHQAAAREPRDLGVTLPNMVPGESPQEGHTPQVGVEIVEKSDEVIVPKKSAKTRVTPVESAEGRTEAEGKTAARNASPHGRSDEQSSPASKKRRRSDGITAWLTSIAGSVECLKDTTATTACPRTTLRWRSSVALYSCSGVERFTDDARKLLGRSLDG